MANSSIIPSITLFRMEVAVFSRNFSTVKNKSSKLSPKLFNLNQDNPSKKVICLVKYLKIKVMITFFIKTLKLPDFIHVATFTI